MQRLPLASFLLFAAVLGGLACPATTETETATSENASSTGTEGTTGEAETTESSTTDAAETGTETETGDMCTGESCASTLTLNFAHSLPLADGPHRFLIDTPTHEISCSVGTADEGAESCFGFMFSDMTWDLELVTVVLTQPFFDTDINPDATPFESVMLRVERGQDEIFAATVPIEGGDPTQPDPCGPVCWEALGSVSVE